MAWIEAFRFGRLSGAAIAVVFSLALASCGGQAASVSPSSTSIATPQSASATASPFATPPASATATASPTMESTEWELSEQAWDPPWSPMEFTAAATNGSRLVVVGGEICDAPEFTWEMPCDAGIWNAPVEDPSALEPVPTNDDLFVGTAHPIMGPFPGTTDVAAGAEGFVAIGYRGMTTTPIEPVIWFSADGQSWEIAEMGDQFDGASLDAVTAGGPGFVIVGTVTLPSAPRAAAWVSPDGRSWERVPEGDAFEVGGYINTGEIPTSGGMRRVVALPDGRGLVAIGVRCEPGGTLTDPGPMGDSDSCWATTWSSPDGVSWSQSEPEVEPPSSLTSVAPLFDGVVAVGGTYFEATGQPSIGTSVVSDDGARWEPPSLEDTPRLDFVVGVPDGVVAFSTDDTDNPFKRELRAWGSSDGEAWTEITGIPQPEGLAVIRSIGATVIGDRLVLVGWAETSTPTSWVSFTLVGPARASSP